MSTSAQQSIINKEPTNFIDCLYMAISSPFFVREYDRLTGSHLESLAKRTPIEELVDEATGYAMEEMTKFATFVKENVWDILQGSPKSS